MDWELCLAHAHPTPLLVVSMVWTGSHQATKMMPAPPSLVRLAGNNMGRFLLGTLILPVLWETGRKEEEKQAGVGAGRWLL